MGRMLLTGFHRPEQHILNIFWRLNIEDLTNVSLVCRRERGGLLLKNRFEFSTQPMTNTEYILYNTLP
jgi:hypothetical protein